MSLNRLQRLWPRFCNWLIAVRTSWRPTTTPSWRLLNHRKRRRSRGRRRARSGPLTWQLFAKEPERLRLRKSFFELAEPRQMLTADFAITGFHTDPSDINSLQLTYDVAASVPADTVSFTLNVYKSSDGVTPD